MDKRRQDNPQQYERIELDQVTTIDEKTKGREQPNLVASSHRKMSFSHIFLLFVSFGFRAFGGPMAQIDMLRSEFITHRKWLTTRKFSRVLALYQILPGPEATEMCCYMGYVGGGRLGSLLAGLGFILPGFCMMLGLTILYANIGVDNSSVLGLYGIKSSMWAMQSAAAAMIVRAVYKIGMTACNLPEIKSSTECVNWPSNSVLAILIAFASFIRTVLGVNFTIVFLLSGVWMNLLLSMKMKTLTRVRLVLSMVLMMAFDLGCTIANLKIPSLLSASPGATSTLALGIATNPRPDNMLALGLLAGSLSFGGAYTALPMLREESVVLGGWLNSTTFLDGIAMVSVLPTPLVMFGTFVGYFGAGLPGALLLTLGIFVPAFAFTICGHEYFERLVLGGKKDSAFDDEDTEALENSTTVHRVLDGITAGVVGMIAVSALQILRDSLAKPADTKKLLVFGAVLYLLQYSSPTRPWFIPVLMISVAFAGQILLTEEAINGSVYY